MRRRKAMLAQLDQDIRDHLRQETDDNIERGMLPEEARYAAMRKFGNVQRVKEQTQEVWSVRALEQLLQDTRHAWRMLHRNPGFAVAAMLTLALGIGVSTAVFSAINTVLLRPLPYPAPDRLVALSSGVSSLTPGSFKPGLAGADFAEWQKQSHSFDQLAGYSYRDATLAASDTADQVRKVSIAGNFWTLTGAQAELGSLFGPNEPEGAIVLSDAVFKRQFRSDPHLIGRVITLDGKPVTVRGVLAPRFQVLFPQDFYSLASAEVAAFVPAPPLLRSPPSRLFVVARLRPRTTIANALAELRGIEASILKTYPDRWFPGVARMEFLPLQLRLVGASNRQALLILQAAGLFVLLIACSNIANLLLARGAARSTELAIRSAIGAGAPRLLQQFVAEGIVLALFGGALGLLVARVVMLLMVRFGSGALPRLSQSSMDGRVLAFALLLCLGSGILFGLAPAMSLWHADLQNALKDGTRSASGTRSSLRLRRILVASELAAAIVLLTGAGLMVKSLWKMDFHPPGFAPEHTLLVKVSLSGPRYAEKSRQRTYFHQLVRSIQAAPGIIAFGIANIQDYLLQSSNRSVAPLVDQFRESLISPGYPQAMGMRLLKGNWLTDTDAADAALINETMARRAFGSRNPLGRRIDQLGRPVRVVGVVANLKYARRDATPGAEIFRLYAENLNGGNTTITVAIRAGEDPLTIAPELRKRIAAIDPAQPIYEIQTLDQALSDSVAPRRLNLFLLVTFAGGALLIALVGVYGVIAYSVTQRTREIGIRMALGAQRSQVLCMIMTQGILMTLWSVAAGIGAALLLTRLMTSLLYDVAPNDPFTFSAIAALLFITVLLASWGPAFKASRINPQLALRHD